MTDSLRRRCELMASNRALMRRSFKYDDPFVLTFCADAYAVCNSIADINKIKACRQLIHESTGAFSIYRSFCKNYFAVMLSLDPDPRAKLYRTLDIYSALRKYFHRSCYLSFAAYLLAENSERAPQELASHTSAVYKLMRSTLPRETSGRDVIFAAVWVLSGKYNSDIEGFEHNASSALEAILKKRSKRRVIHSIAASSEGFERIGKRMLTISELLSELKHKYGSRYEQYLLSVLGRLDVPEDELVSSIDEVFEYLKDRPEFSRFMSRRDLLMHSALAVLNEYTVSDLSEVDPEQRAAVKSLNVSYQAAVFASLSEYAVIIASQQAYS